MVEAERRQQHQEVHNLIPGLPDEIAMECLIRVPYKFHYNMKFVCRTWQNLISDPSFYQERIKSGTAEHLVCQVQPLPSPPKDSSTHLITGYARINGSKKEEEQNQNQNQNRQIQSSPPQYGLTIYNTSNQTWQRINPGKIGGIPMFCQCLALQSSKKLLLLGGWDPITLEPVPDVYVLDMVKGGNFRRAAPMLVARSFFACAVVGNSSVYVAGGHDNQKNALKSAEVYDVEADEWRMLPDMQEERDECLGMCWEGDDRFWVVSGYGTESQGRFRSDAECYDPVTGLWSKFDGFWPFSSLSPRGSTASASTIAQQHHWLWFLSNEQQQQQEQLQPDGGVKEYEDKERKWKMVRSIVSLPNTITGTSPCVSVTTLGDHFCQNQKQKQKQKQKQRVFVMAGNGSRGSASLICNECEGEGGFIMERDNKSGHIKWNHVHVPVGFSGFPYSSSYLLI